MNDKKNNDIEQIHIDKRDMEFTNTHIDSRIAKLMDISTPVCNDYGLELNEFTRFIWICNLVSYITDGDYLNKAIEYLKNNFEEKDAFKQTEDYLENLNQGQYTSDDFIKIKAIYFSIRAKYMAFVETFNFTNGHLPTFKIELDGSTITHNFSFVEAVVLRNFEIEYKENLKKLPFDIAVKIYNDRIESLIDLDFLHDTGISSKTIEFLEKCRKMLVENAKLSNQAPQQNVSIKTISTYPHPIFQPNLWNKDCFELFKYFYDCYFTSTNRQLTNIWFYLKESGSNKYVLKATKDQYKDFILQNYNRKITNFDKTEIKWKEKEYITIDEHRINFENTLK